MHPKTHVWNNFLIFWCFEASLFLSSVAFPQLSTSGRTGPIVLPAEVENPGSLWGKRLHPPTSRSNGMTKPGDSRWKLGFLDVVFRSLLSCCSCGRSRPEKGTFFLVEHRVESKWDGCEMLVKILWTWRVAFRWYKICNRLKEHWVTSLGYKPTVFSIPGDAVASNGAASRGQGPIFFWRWLNSNLFLVGSKFEK